MKNNDLEDIVFGMQTCNTKGTYISEKPVSISGNNRIQLKCDFIDGSIENRIKQPILYSFALDKPPGQKIIKRPRTKFEKKIERKSVSNKFTFNVEDDKNNIVDFNDETLAFTILSKTIKSDFS